jgi:signal transduction histidine kinase
VTTTDPARVRTESARYARRIAAICVATGIFLLDTFANGQITVAVLYVLVLVVADEGEGGQAVRGFAVLCSALALASFVVDHGSGPDAGSILRLVISLAAITVTAVLLVRNGLAQRAARANDLRYRTIFDTVAIAFWEHDFSEVEREIELLRRSGVQDFRAHLMDHPEFVVRMRRIVAITDVNETALRLLRVPTKAQFFTHLADFLPEEDESFFDCLLAIDERRPVFETETRLRTLDGDHVDVFVNLGLPPRGTPLDRICGSIMDVTERKRTQDMLERTRVKLDDAMRAATVGELSASIAHEVSQPLLAVRAQTEAARRWLAKSPPAIDDAREAMREAADAAVGASEIIHRVRRLDARSEPRRAVLRSDELLGSAVALAQRQFVGTAFEIDGDAEDALIDGDETALRHMLLNLFKNAHEAMEEADADERRVQVRWRKQGSRVTIWVEDGGPGFPDAVLDRPFDPLSGPRDGRVGVGLAMCRSIVEAHGGDIDVGRGEELGGALVRVHLPISSDSLKKG